MNNLYRIGTIAEWTGFSTHVLRAWERRYDLLDPERSESGQRLYTEKDLAVLRRVRELKDAGRRIGEIAHLGRARLLAEAPELSDPATASKGEDGTGPGDADATPGWNQPGDTFFKAVLEALPVGVILTDAAGETRWANSGFSELCGYGIGELRGHTPGSVLQGPATDEETVGRMSRALRAGRPFSERVLNYHRTHSHYWVDLDVTPLDSAAGVEGYVGVARRLEDRPRTVREREAQGEVREAIQSLTSVAAEGQEGSSRLLMSLADVLAALPQR